MHWEIVWLYLPCFIAAIFGLLWVLVIMFRDYGAFLKKQPQAKATHPVTGEAAAKKN